MAADDLIAQLSEEAMLLEPRDHFDEALVAVDASPQDHWPRKGGLTVAVYNSELCVGAIQAWLGCDERDAVDYFDFNTSGSWVGEGTPIFRECDDDTSLLE